MDIRSLLLLLLLSMSWSVLANKNTVYRWVDKHNVVHFSQQKPFDNTITDLSTVSIYNASEDKKTSNLTSELTQSPDNTTLSTPLEQDDLLVQQQHNKDKKAEMFKKNCDAATANLKTLNSFRRVIYPDENGNQRMLSPEEKEEQIKYNTENVALYCHND